MIVYRSCKDALRKYIRRSCARVIELGESGWIDRNVYNYYFKHYPASGKQFLIDRAREILEVTKCGLEPQMYFAQMKLKKYEYAFDHRYNESLRDYLSSQ